MLPFGQHFKNIFKTALHPVTAPAEVIPQYEKIGNALILAAIVVVIIALIGSISSISVFLIDMAIDKAEMKRSVFNSVYDGAYIAKRILKYCFYPFIYYAIKTFGLAGLAMLAGLIVKEKWSFSKLLATAALALAPAYLISELLGSFIGREESLVLVFKHKRDGICRHRTDPWTLGEGEAGTNRESSMGTYTPRVRGRACAV